jgi:hypothetical protein
MESVNRRSFLIKGSVGAAAVAGVVGSGFALTSLVGDDETALPAGADELDGPVLVQITHASSGEVEVLVGEREVTFNDRALVARVLRAAS